MAPESSSSLVSHDAFSAGDRIASSPHGIAITISILCTALAIGVLLWLAASNTSHADTLRPLLIDEQRTGNRHARLSNPDNLARLARLGGTLEDVRLNLVELVERSRAATDMHALQVEFQDRDPETGMDLKGAAASMLRLSIDATLIHESTLLDLIATVKAAAGAWPLRVRGCAITRVAPEVSSSALQPIRARCTLEIVHWFWPDAQASSSLPIDGPLPSSTELQGQRLFFTSKEREALDHEANVKSTGVLASANAALGKSDDSVLSVVEAASADQSSSEPSATAAASDAGDSVRRKRDLRGGVQQSPAIVFGGVIRGTSSTIALLNGVPCQVEQGGLISLSCGRPQPSGLGDPPIESVWIKKRAADADRGPHLRVVYADGQESLLSVGERTLLVQ